jgi:NAD(P)-dependent dehydrogenase (short-subunit alcohol dehydrogenase family)
MSGRSSRTVLITGGGRGIGAACAQAFFARGANVVVVSRTARELGATARRISGAGRGASRMLALPGDVGDEAFVRSAFAAARARFGRVDVLINNAAVLVVAELAKLEAGDWDATMAANLRGPFLCSREFLRQFSGPGAGARRLIVNVGSLGGIQNTAKFPGMGAYVASKSGLTGLTEALAVEGRARGVAAFALAPGAVATEMLRRAAPHLKAGATPADVAGLVADLADCDAAPLLSGAVIPLDTNR